MKEEIRKLLLEGKTDEVVAKGEVAVPHLIEALEDDNALLRFNAAAVLGELKDARAVPVLIEALKDAGGIVRRLAAKMLGKIKDARAVPALIKALDETDIHLRENAVLALRSMRDAKIVPPLIEALNTENFRVRRGAAKVLFKLAEVMDIPLLKVGAALKDFVKQAQDEKEEVRHEAVVIYAKIAKAVSDSKEKQMGGILSSGTVPKPSRDKGKIYRMRRATV